MNISENTNRGTSTSAGAWRASTGGGTPLVVPSGNTCLVRKAEGMEVFLRQGKVPNSLMPMVQEAMKKGKAPSLEEMEMTPDLLQAMLEMADNVCLGIVLEPELRPAPINAETQAAIPLADRPDLGDSALYIDEVSFEDRMFIFQWAVGGTDDVATFRSETGPGMATLPGL